MAVNLSSIDSEEQDSTFLMKSHLSTLIITEKWCNIDLKRLFPVSTAEVSILSLPLKAPFFR